MTEHTPTTTGPSQVSRSLVTYLKDRDVLCSSCGYNLRDHAASRCPECGCELDVTMLRAAPGNASQAPILAVRVLSAVAFVIAAYLALMAIIDKQPAGCSGSGGCGTVLASRWSSLWGVPVSLPAMLVYAGIFIATFWVRPSRSDAKRRDGWLLLLVLGTFAGLGALWFIGLQAFEIKSFCPYCMIDHSCGLLIAGLVWYQAPIRRGERLGEKVRSTLILPLGRTLKSTFAVAAVMGLFIACQLKYPASTHEVIEQPIAKGNGPYTTLDNKPVPPVRPRDGIAKDGSTTDSATKDASTKTTLPEPLKDGNDPTTKDGTAKDGSPRIDFPKDDTKRPTPPTKTVELPTTNGSPPDFSKFVVLNLPEAPRGAGVLLDRSAFPVKGDPKAKFLFVCLVDYTCPHCKELHAAFGRTFERYGDQIAFMLLPMPLNSECNRFIKNDNPQHAYACDLAHTAMAVWKIDPRKFATLDDWLFGDPFPRTAREAREKAIELVGKEAFDKMIASDFPAEQVQKHIEVYGMAGQGRIPKLMFQNFRVEGTIQAESLWRLLEEREDLGIRPLR